MLATLKLSPRLERKVFYVGKFKISSQAPDILSHLITFSHSLTHLITPYLLGWKENHFMLTTLKLVPRIQLLSHLFQALKTVSLIVSKGLFSIRSLHGKFPIKEKKLLLVGPPDSEKTNWFSPFQGMLITLIFFLVMKK